MTETCDVIITSAEDQPLIIRELRGMGFDLSSAKGLMDDLPNAVVKRGVSRQDADRIKARFEKAGATVELR